MDFKFVDLNTALDRHLVPLQDALLFQSRILSGFERKGSADAHYVLYAEHVPIYTYANEEEGEGGLGHFRPGTVEPLRAPLVCVERSGGITFHGPGQITYYLILVMDKLVLQKSLSEYADEVIVKALAELGIRAHSKPLKSPVDPGGVWHTYCEIQKKIASRSFLVRDVPGVGPISSFGFSLNVNTELSLFEPIYPGDMNIEMTSMEQILGSPTPLHEVAQHLNAAILEVFKEKQSP